MSTNFNSVPPPLPGERRGPPGVLVHGIIGAVVVGSIAFAFGFFGPMFWLKHNSPQGPMLGIFVTGPAGFVVGLVGGMVVGLVRRRRGVGS